MFILYQVASLLQHVNVAEHGVPSKVQTHGYCKMIFRHVETQYAAQYCLL